MIQNGSQTQLSDMSNRQLSVEMSASFPSPGELQKRLLESDLAFQSASNLNIQTPLMTSFREIANSQASLAMSTDSPMCLSISEVEENRQRRSKSVASEANGSFVVFCKICKNFGQRCFDILICSFTGMMSKFIRLDDSVASIGSQSSSARSESRNAEPKSIFPMFIGVGSYDSYDEGGPMSQSIPPANDINSIRSRAVRP